MKRTILVVVFFIGGSGAGPNPQGALRVRTASGGSQGRKLIASFDCSQLRRGRENFRRKFIVTESPDYFLNNEKWYYQIVFDKNKIKISNMKMVYYAEKITQYLAILIFVATIIFVVLIFFSPNDCQANAVESICFPDSMKYMIFAMISVPISLVLFFINRIFNTIKISIVKNKQINNLAIDSQI